jgi:hypothetical protein
MWCWLDCCGALVYTTHRIQLAAIHRRLRPLRPLASSSMRMVLVNPQIFLGQGTWLTHAAHEVDKFWHHRSSANPIIRHHSAHPLTTVPKGQYSTRLGQIGNGSFDLLVGMRVCDFLKPRSTNQGCCSFLDQHTEDQHHHICVVLPGSLVCPFDAG